MNFFSDTLTYPFRKGGKYMLAIGAVLGLAPMVPVIGGFAWVVLVGYFSAVYFQIIQSTAIGKDEAPNYPDTSNILDDLIRPVLQIAAVLLVSFGPLIIYALSVKTAHPGIVMLLTGIALWYAPMAILAIVILGYMGAMSPHIVFPAIVRAGWLYYASIGLLFAIYAGEHYLTKSVSGIFIVSQLLIATMSMYVMMANGRALGLIYRERQEELNWL